MVTLSFAVLDIMTVWHCFHGRISGETKRDIVARIEATGLEVYPLNPDFPKGPGLLFFDDINQALCSFLRETTNNSLERVIAISTQSSSLHPAVWSLLEAGASDVITWDDPSQRSLEIHQRISHWQQIDRIVDSPLVTENLIGKSPAWLKVLRQIVEIARFTDSSVLITGESGTGKELVARLIHTLDPRPQKQELVLLDCTTIVPSLSGSEFFGHERGAFTGAHIAREGAFARADGGTLFLDEIGELSTDLQAQLLRAVQEKAYKQVGGSRWHKTNFRLICATNKDLSQEVSEGRFRSDLFYRLSVWSCKLPPLRERVDDVLPLAEHFLKQFTSGRGAERFSPAVGEFILRRKYPGNIRDLKQLIARLVYRHVGTGPLTVGDIPEEERPSSESLVPAWCGEQFEKAVYNAVQMGIGLKDIGRHAEDIAVRLAVHAEEGNLQRAARRLGVTDRTLQLRRALWRQNEGPVDFEQ